MAIVERKYRQRRVPFHVFPGFVIGVALAAKWVPLLPVGIADRLLTFFYKDDEYLNAAQPVPGFEFRRFI